MPEYKIGACGERHLIKQGVSFRHTFFSSFLMVMAIFLAAFLSGCQTVGPPAGGASAALSFASLDWAHDSSDLAPDPGARFGRLDNGFRYVLVSNAQPRNRVSMHLVVQVGSLYEKEDEQGAAHFLEHMLFNGSTHFPPGELIKYFQRIGMQFGPDANAHTGFTQTVYDILLPAGDPAYIREGLTVMRDYASGALLLESEIDKERRVILAEKRSRDSAALRTFEKTLQFELPGTLAARRLPIGTEAVLKQIDRRRLKHFYDTWYRPERMILVVTGDFDLRQMGPLIENAFGDMASRVPAGVQPHPGGVSHRGVKAFYHFEKETGSTSISIETLQQQPARPDTRQQQKQLMIESLGDRMLNQRLDAMLRSGRAAFTSAGAGSGDFLRIYRYAQVNAVCPPGQWKATLSSLEKALRQAVLFGFSDAELQRAKKNLATELDTAANQAATRQSQRVARDIIGSIRNHTVFRSARQDRDLLVPLLKDISADQVNKAFAANWPSDHRLVLVTGNAKLNDVGGLSPEDLILADLRDSFRQPVQPYKAKAVLSFPYLDVPATATVQGRQVVYDDLGVVKTVFDNGFVLHVKKTPFKANHVMVNLMFGRGRSSESRGQQGLAILAADVINESGFGRMDQAMLMEALAGKTASIRLQVREDAFVLHGESSSKELTLLFDLMYAFMHDTGIRDQAFGMALARYGQRYQSMVSSVDGLMQVKGRRFLAGGDTRFGMPSEKQMRRLSVADIKTWLLPQMNSGAPEMAVVGDIDPQVVRQLAGRYFGRRPIAGALTSDAADNDRRSPIFPAGQKRVLSARTRIDKCLVVVAYPTADMWDISRTRRLSLLAEVFSERLRERIRESLGAAYSPVAFNRPYRAYPGFGLFMVYIQTDPVQRDLVVTEVKKIAASLDRQPVSGDEFRRALDPTLHHIKDLRQTNAYWLDSVLTGAGRHPQQLDWARSIEKDYAAITAEQVTQLARQYLKNERAAVVVVEPDGKP